MIIRALALDKTKHVRELWLALLTSLRNSRSDRWSERRKRQSSPWGRWQSAAHSWQSSPQSEIERRHAWRQEVLPQGAAFNFPLFAQLVGHIDLLFQNHTFVLHWRPQRCFVTQNQNCDDTVSAMSHKLKIGACGRVGISTSETICFPHGGHPVPWPHETHAREQRRKCENTLLHWTHEQCIGSDFSHRHQHTQCTKAQSVAFGREREASL